MAGENYIVIDGVRSELSTETADNLRSGIMQNQPIPQYRYATYKKDVKDSPSRDRLLVFDGETVKAFDTNGRRTNSWTPADGPLKHYTVFASFDVKD